jgi:flavin-dependent dehydrogenase
MMYDAIVVGARCAGSAVALLLAREGYRILLVDRTTFPSDAISTHFIRHPGVVRLKRWGLLDTVLASNCPPIRKWSSNFGDFTLSGQVPLIDDVPGVLAPRRKVLDAILLNAAAEAGAEVRQGFTVTDLLTDGARVVGIRSRSTDATPVTEHARMVIGADGKHSTIAERVQAPMYRHVPALTCWYYTYWSGLPCEGMEINWRHHQLVYTFPTNDRLTLTVVGVPHQEFHEFRRDIEGNYLKAVERIPDLAERFREARREERFYGMADLPNFFRRPYGPGWALVGDAGHHKDPLPAYGISDAFCDAELLADAIHKGFSGEQPPDDALAQYEQSRNARAIPEHDFTRKSARLEMWDSPEALRLRAALRGNQEDTGQYFAVNAGVILPEVFFAPENIQRILSQAKATDIPQ